MSKINILHVLNSTGGGASFGTYEFIKTSNRLGSPFRHFAVYPGKVEDVHLGSMVEKSKPIPLRWWNIKYRYSWLGQAILRAREQIFTGFEMITSRKLDELIKEWNIDLVYTTTACINSGAHAAKRNGIPHLWHIKEEIGANGFLKFSIPDKELVNTIDQLSDAIVCMSNFSSEIFKKHKTEERVKVIYDGIDSDKYGSISSIQGGVALRERLGVKDNEIIIGNVGSVTSQVKNHRLFIQAASEIKKKFPHGVKFIVFGQLPIRTLSFMRKQHYEYYKNLTSLVNTLGLKDDFIWADNVSDPTHIMNAIDILAHACAVEGFGRVAIEAMAAKKPVVCPDHGGMTEAVINEITGFHFVRENSTEMAIKIETLINNKSLRLEMGSKGFQKVSTEFSNENHCLKMTALINNLIDNR